MYAVDFVHSKIADGKTNELIEMVSKSASALLECQAPEHAMVYSFAFGYLEAIRIGGLA
jgi:hypothetical protein